MKFMLKIKKFSNRSQWYNRIIIYLNVHFKLNIDIPYLPDQKILP